MIHLKMKSTPLCQAERDSVPADLPRAQTVPQHVC